jgi:hypothetical protein
MRTPDFLVVGAARAGTTSLHSYLRQHPGIFLPDVKEPCFFVFDGKDVKYVKGKFAFAVRDFSSYEKLFRGAGADQKTGEMSTPYLYLHDKAISTIKKYFNSYNEIRIVIMLRNPVDRAYSQYRWRVRDGREPLDFIKAIDVEQERMKSNYSFDYFYLDRGFYFKQVKSYMDNFRHVHIILFEDFDIDPQKVLRDLCLFLGVDGGFHFKKLIPQNESSLPRSKFLGRIVTSESKLKYKVWYAIPDPLRKKIRKIFTDLNTKGKLSMDPFVRKKLTEIYHEDILALQKLIGRDLSGWL